MSIPVEQVTPKFSGLEQQESLSISQGIFLEIIYLAASGLTSGMRDLRCHMQNLFCFGTWDLSCST